MHKYTLIVNAGSTSIKVKLFDSNECIESIIEKSNNAVTVFKQIYKKLIKKYDLNSDNVKVGHRVVSGYGIFKEDILINKNNLKTLNDNKHLAPLHNPYSLAIISLIADRDEKIVQYVVFDSTFHTTIPAINKTYLIPKKYSKGIEKIGAHGISVQSVLRDSKLKNAIVVHMGGGSSVTLVVNGKSVNTTMGLSPLGGVPSMTRTGDIDPTVIFEIARRNDVSLEQLEMDFNKKSGISISGLGPDDLDHKNEYIKIYVMRVVSAIASYYNESKGKAKDIIFTGGIPLHYKNIVSSIIKNIIFDVRYQIIETKEEEEILYRWKNEWNQ